MPPVNVLLLWAYIAAVLTLLFTPGPVVLLVSGTAARGSYARAFLTALGTHLASLVLIALAIMVLAGAVSLSPFLLNMVALGGSLFITASSLTALRQGAAEPRKGNAQGGFFQGFMTGMANPKDILFFIAFFPQFIAITRDFIASVTILSTLWILLDFSVLSLYIIAIKRWLPVTQSYRFARLSSLILLVIGIAGAGYSFMALRAH
ncbi:LysE family translocator [Kosakonia sp. BK9b]